MQESEEETREKQLYLRKMILGKGYEPVAFTEYLSSQRTEGHDIINWSMKDLQEVVERYVRDNPAPERKGSQDGYLMDTDNDDSIEEAPKPKQGSKASSKASSEDKKKDINESSASDKRGPEPISALATTEEVFQETSKKTLNDQRQQIKQMIITQSDEEKAAMNDFNMSVPNFKTPKLTELNGERRLKIKVST